VAVHAGEPGKAECVSAVSVYFFEFFWRFSTSPFFGGAGKAEKRRFYLFGDGEESRGEGVKREG
jgi:hypothetical protein